MKMEEITGLVAVIGLFGGTILTIYFYLRARNKERMAMIEKGVELESKPKPSRPIRSLKMGMLSIGIALGIFLGHIVGSYTKIDEVVAFFVMILLFGGIALSLNYILELKLKKGEE
jgi:hypothetical protein